MQQRPDALVTPPFITRRQKARICLLRLSKCPHTPHHSSTSKESVPRRQKTHHALIRRGLGGLPYTFVVPTAFLVCVGRPSWDHEFHLWRITDRVTLKQQGGCCLTSMHRRGVEGVCGGRCCCHKVLHGLLYPKGSGEHRVATIEHHHHVLIAQALVSYAVQQQRRAGCVCVICPHANRCYRLAGKNGAHLHPAPAGRVARLNNNKRNPWLPRWRGYKRAAVHRDGGNLPHICVHRQ
ncbi:hypothetical protein ECC02_011069 [Trypanosoma cruzi]|uniref:Uncharacterized protein n=1 Tax=Trypanosoma cruzi TaxID=5693 RepID=A0A7J6XNS8_TRYCR|nr:hypothetical protein ECC02_011069 [Trypanosoma cruzi]